MITVLVKAGIAAPSIPAQRTPGARARFDYGDFLARVTLTRSEDRIKFRLHSADREAQAMKRGVWIGGVLALFLVLTTAPARAQLATAELNGRVTDASGAVLPGATVTATQTATGLMRTVVTDGTGTYVLSNLPPGPYQLDVSLLGTGRTQPGYLHGTWPVHD
jgi:hypothetical protein